MMNGPSTQSTEGEQNRGKMDRNVNKRGHGLGGEGDGNVQLWGSRGP